MIGGHQLADIGEDWITGMGRLLNGGDMILTSVCSEKCGVDLGVVSENGS